ncbi:MAG: crossover junction endodeoxyribonuclease [Bdellovibrionales bacterium]
MSLFIGIDPGLTGGIAFRVGEEMDVFPMPIFKITKGKKTRRVLDLTALSRLVDDKTKNAPRVQVYIEQVSAMPKQGVSSTFSFGESYGAIKGIVAANFLPMTLVPPRTWKSKLKVSPNKDDARYRASQLMPRFAHFWPRHKDDGLAEAAMIAFFGQHYGEEA